MPVARPEHGLCPASNIGRRNSCRHFLTDVTTSDGYLVSEQLEARFVPTLFPVPSNPVLYHSLSCRGTSQHNKIHKSVLLQSMVACLLDALASSSLPIVSTLDGERAIDLLCIMVCKS